MRRAGLEGLAVPHQRFERVRLHRAGESFARTLAAGVRRDGHDLLVRVEVHLVQDHQRLLHGLVGGLVRRVPLLPQELGRPQEQPGAHLPPHDVAPLVVEQRQVPVALDPPRVGVPDDGLGGRPDHERLLEVLAAGVRHHGHLRREPFDVLLLPLQQVRRDEHGEVQVLVAGGLDPVVDGALDGLPDPEPVRLDHHRAAGQRVLGQPGLLHDLLVPAGEVLLLRGERHGPHRIAAVD